MRSNPRHAAPPRGRLGAATRAAGGRVWVPGAGAASAGHGEPGPLPAGHVERWALQAAGGEAVPVSVPVPDRREPAPGRVVVDPFGRLRPPRPQWSPTTTVLAYVPSQRGSVRPPAVRPQPARPAVLAAGLLAVAGLLVARVAGLV